MSPSSRGIITGLLFALVAAVTVLAMNQSWLLPGADETGVGYLTGAPMIVAGVSPQLPWAAWDAAEPRTEMRSAGTGLPHLMAVLMRVRPRVHVAALWAMAASAAFLLLAVGWVGGAVAGASGAALACALVIVSGAPALLVTSVRPELLAMAAVALQLGLMTYLPRRSLGHGLAGGFAWLCHPAGVGAAAAAVVWPLVRGRVDSTAARGALLAALPPLALFASRPIAGGMFAPSLTLEASDSPLGALGHWLRWSGGGVDGAGGVVLGLLAVGAAVGLVLAEASSSPPADPEVHWKDPRVHDALAVPFRKAAALLTVTLLVGAMAGLGPAGVLGKAWALALVPFAVLVSGAVIRSMRRGSVRSALVTGGVVSAWVVLTTLGTAGALQDVFAEGHGFTARKWIESEVVRWVDNRSEGMGPLYSAEPPLFVIQSNRGSRRLPASDVGASGFAEHWRARPGPVILTGAQADPARVAEYRAALDVEEVVSSPEGVVLVPRGAVGGS